jgi:hypothetical protein
MSTEWTYLLADTLTNRIFAEVPLDVSAVNLQLNKSATLSATLPVRSIIGDPYRFTTPARTCVYVLRNGQPWWGGIIWTRTYDDGQISIAAGDWWSYYKRRYLTTVPPAIGAVDDQVTMAADKKIFTGVPQWTVVRDLLALASAAPSGDLQVKVIAPAVDTAPLLTVTYEAKALKSIGDLLTDLTAGATGCDLQFGVQGFTSSGAPQRVVWVGGPQLTHGAQGLVWEYGANMLSYSWQSDGSEFADRVWVKGGGSGTVVKMVRADNPARITDGWPLVEFGDAADDDMDYPALNARAAADVLAHRLPVVVPSLTVRTDRPPFLDFQPGDQARLIIRDDYFRTPISVDVRVVGLAANMKVDTCDIDVNAIIPADPITEDIS